MGCQIGSAPKSRNRQLHFVEVENGGNESSSHGLVDTKLPRPWFTIGLVLSRCVVWDRLGVIGGPLMLIGLIAGYGASIITMIYGSWDQRLIVALPFLQYTAIFISPLF